MPRYTILSLISFISLFAGSCRQRPEDLLLQAVAIVEQQPDSALVLLERIDTAGLNEGLRKEYLLRLVQAKSAGDVTLKALSKEIVQRGTVSSADTLAVLDSLTQVLCERLAEGQIVRFGDFGSFQIAINSEGAESQRDVCNLLCTRKQKRIWSVLHFLFTFATVVQFRESRENRGQYPLL